MGIDNIGSMAEDMVRHDLIKKGIRVKKGSKKRPGMPDFLGDDGIHYEVKTIRFTPAQVRQLCGMKNVMIAIAPAIRDSNRLGPNKINGITGCVAYVHISEFFMPSSQ